MVYLHTGPMGVHRACFFIARAGRAATPERNRSGNQPPILCILPLVAHQLASARENFLEVGGLLSPAPADPVEPLGVIPREFVDLEIAIVRHRQTVADGPNLDGLGRALDRLQILAGQLETVVPKETVARIPGYRIMPPSPCARSWSSGPGLGRAAPAAGPAPVGPRSPAASEPGRPSSASCGSDGCHAPPRSRSRPAAARPKTPAPSPTPAPAAS